MPSYPDVLMMGAFAGGVAGMVKLSDFTGTGLGIRSKSVEVVPVHYSRYITLGNGNLLGQGYKLAEWHLNGIRHAHWNVFYGTYRTAQSTQVYIRTYSEDGKTFQNYLANMLWTTAPPSRDHDTNVVLDFTINFIQMIQQ